MMNTTYFQQRKQKKSGFGLFGLFKKKGSQPKQGKERPKSSYAPRDWSPNSRSPSTSPNRDGSPSQVWVLVQIYWSDLPE